MDSIDFKNTFSKIPLFLKHQKTHTLEELISCGFWLDKQDIPEIHNNTLSLSFYQSLICLLMKLLVLVIFN